MMLRAVIALVAGTLLGACGYVSEYEKGVYDYEATYCYKSLAAVHCFDEPYHRDEKRLVNYYGPAPSRYETPEAPLPVTLAAPPAIDYFVRDPEPIPEPAPRRPKLPLPWLKNNAWADPDGGPAPEDADVDVE
jgi:hypothetical protein